MRIVTCTVERAKFNDKTQLNYFQDEAYEVLKLKLYFKHSNDI